MLEVQRERCAFRRTFLRCRKGVCGTTPCANCAFEVRPGLRRNQTANKNEILNLSYSSSLGMKQNPNAYNAASARGRRGWAPQGQVWLVPAVHVCRIKAQRPRFSIALTRFSCAQYPASFAEQFLIAAAARGVRRRSELQSHRAVLDRHVTRRAGDFFVIVYMRTGGG